MIRKMYMIRDAKAECFHLPFVAHTEADAVRSLKRLFQDPQSMMSQFPEDYDLYFLGEFDDEKGRINQMDTPQHVVKAVMLLTQSKPVQI